MAFPTLQNQPLPNFPTSLDRVNDGPPRYSFPEDLTNAEKRKFYTYIGFSEYSFSQQFNGYKGNHIITGEVRLPIPVKLDDNLVLNWGQVSFTDEAIKMAGQLSGGFAAGFQLVTGIGGIVVGQTLNPLLFLQFQRPDFRQFSLSWVMTPRNEKESVAIKNIVTKCKKAASPSLAAAGFTLKYPEVAHIRMYPDDLFGHMIFKPCVINSVQVSYSGSPTPSFLNSKGKKGAPTVVTLTLNLTEMQFWYKNEIT